MPFLLGPAAYSGLANVGNHTDDSCPNGIEWINKYFGECATDNLQVAAFFIGLSSILCWLCAQAPQIYMNYKNGNADSLAFPFLVQWLLGDLTNLVGAILTGQLPTQIYTAVYFVIIDFVMCMQWLYYKLKNRDSSRYKHLKILAPDRPAERQVTSLKAVGATLVLFPLAALASYPGVQSLGVGAGAGGVAMGTVRRSIAAPAGRVLMASSVFSDPKQTAGYILGIVSATLYLGSRVPQILKNFMRRSTGGLSFSMFVLAVLGNLTYSAGIFMHSMDKEFLLEKTPWLVGSVGTLCFDFTIFMQFLMYGNREAREEEEKKPLLGGSSTSLAGFDSTAGGGDSDSDQGYSGVNASGEPISPLMFPASKSVKNFLSEA